MASPIDYIIHPDPPQPQKPGHPVSGTHNSLFVTSGPASASPSTAPAGPVHHTQTHSGAQNQTQALYQCAECLRRYSRPEHLQRHIASHTLGKRFTCDICFKGFARADLLKRHRSNHQDGNGNKRRKRFNSAPSASRVGQACTACAKSRVKCEDVKPCTRCKTRGLTCEVTSEDPTVHSAHPSEHRTGHTESTPDSCCSLSSGSGQPQRLFPAAPAPPSYVGSTSPEDNKQGIVPLAYTAYQEPEVYTPEASSATVAQRVPNHLHAYSSNSVRYAGNEHAGSPFPDFLCNLLYEQPLGNPSRLPDAQGAPMLDFYDDAALDFNEFDFNLLNWNLDATQVTPDDTASAEDPAGMAEMRSTLDKLWTESPWRWTPGKTDNCYTEQSNLPLPSNDAHSPKTRHDGAVGGWAANETLRAACRDKILAIVLGTCRESRMANRVASSFPSADTMDSWINIFMAAHMSQVASWIHYGSFSLNSQWPEWLAVAAAAGAVLTPVPAFRRFGLALQEAIRIAIPERFEENNKSIAEINKVQALVLLQDVALWSGNRRKMEIAECHLSIPMAMMRYRGRFGPSAYPDIVISPSDEGKVLEEKWKAWYQQESWKRLVFHAYLRDAQVSMTQLNNPFMSYAELNLPLPCSRDLWLARNAEEFKARYLRPGGNARPPSLGDLFRDTNAFSAHHTHVDIQFATSIYLHAFWSLIWEYRQLSSIHSPTTSNTNTHTNTTALLLTSRRTDLITQLATFHNHHLTHPQPAPNSSPTIPPHHHYHPLLLHHHHLFHLHAPLPDLQLFSGKEGEDQARRVYPALQRWAASPDARRAVWHAAQVLRCARAFPRGRLRDFWGVAVFQVMLGVWGWGVLRGVADSGLRRQQQREGRGRGDGVGARVGVVVDLDGEDSEREDVRAWIADGLGRPAIRGLRRGGGREEEVACLLEDPRACMGVAQEVLRANFVGVWEGLPPLSENIIVVLKQLEKAASAVVMG